MKTIEQVFDNLQKTGFIELCDLKFSDFCKEIVIGKSYDFHVAPEQNTPVKTGMFVQLIDIVLFQSKIKFTFSQQITERHCINPPLHKCKEFNPEFIVENNLEDFKAFFTKIDSELKQ